MNKLNMKTKDLIEENIKLAEKIFPQTITEIERDGKLIKTVNLEVFKKLFGDFADSSDEVYELTWAGKNKSRQKIVKPINKTLRPVPEDSVDFENTENLYIEGDNFEVLKLLQESYLNKVKMIYIDPPYNTGTSMIYSNDFSQSQEEYDESVGAVDEEGNKLFMNTETSGRFHSNWLNMMHERIVVAKDLLRDDGFMAIAIDHNELANLIVMCDNIFGEINRLGIVTVVHKPEGRNQEKFFGTSNEFMLVYAKERSQANFNNVVLDEEKARLFDKEDDDGKYKLNNYIRLGGGDQNLRVNKPHFFYPVYVSSNLKDISLDKKEGYTKVLPITTSGQERTWKTKKESMSDKIRNNEILAEKDNKNKLQIFEKYRENQVIKTHWVDKKYNAINQGTKILDSLFGKRFFDFPKPLPLIIDILKLTTGENDIILDFFAGSGTTAHAVMQMNSDDGGNRKFIMIQIPEETNIQSEAYKAGYKTISQISMDRIKKSSEKIKKEFKVKFKQKKLGKDNDKAELDFGFRVFKLDSSNMKNVYYNPKEIDQRTLSNFKDNIKEDRTDKDLLYQVLLELAIPISAKVKEEKVNKKTIYKVNENFLVACFEENVDLETIKQIAELKPLRIVFKDSSFKDDATKVNCDEYLKNKLSNTIVKVI